MSSIIALWDTIVVSVAVIAIVVIALGLMIRVIDLPGALRHIGAALGSMVILIMVPPITVHLWGVLSVWQQLGITALVGLVATVAWERRQSHSRKRRSHHES